MEKGESNPTDFNQTANAGIQRMGVRLRAGKQPGPAIKVPNSC